MSPDQIKDLANSIIAAAPLAATPKAGVNATDDSLAKSVTTAALTALKAGGDNLAVFNAVKQALSLPSVLGGVDQGSSADGGQCNEQSSKQPSLTLDFVRLGVKAGLLMAAADCGNHSEDCMEDAMTSAGLSKLDRKMLDAECNAADAIRKQISGTCEDSALGYAAYMLPDEDQAALAVLGVTSDWLYRKSTGEPSRKEMLDPVAPRALPQPNAPAPAPDNAGLVSGGGK